MPMVWRRKCYLLVSGDFSTVSLRGRFSGSSFALTTLGFTSFAATIQNVSLALP